MITGFRMDVNYHARCRVDALAYIYIIDVFGKP
jgi:hypothetical protein